MSPQKTGTLRKSLLKLICALIPIAKYRRKLRRKWFPPPVVRTSQSFAHDPDYTGMLYALQNQFYWNNYNSDSRESKDYIPRRDSQHTPKEGEAKILAFYLPQFHSFKENDEWWGKGFTEWTNVTRAMPQYEGHYQPHLPDELGFYNLMEGDIFHKQTAMARQYGIHGFCFHYYWFSGRKRLLEKPLFRWLEDKSIDFPFCLCWANEPWSRRWDGFEQDILMPQDFKEEEIPHFYEDIRQFFLDPRYIKVNNKPLFVFYRPNLFGEELVTKALAVWKEMARQDGFDGIHAVYAQTFGCGEDTMDWGFEAAVEFPPHSWYPEDLASPVILNPDFDGAAFDSEKKIERIMSRPQPNYILYRTIVPGWDNTARKLHLSHSMKDMSIPLYEKWLQFAIESAYKNPTPSEPFVFINAWNEWAEGAHLEPDRKFGFAYLDATERVLSDTPITL